MSNADVHEEIRAAARANAKRAPDFFTTEQREVLARTFVPALRRVRESKAS
ncbi:hypothetical protein [Williamsia soli]|uniref:hypothetical protein n=1 Tax=Williamsia soli TaxID=364929 RepID=UPI001A9F4412|nr:hypothetical protein [Williamsia soli]